MGPYLVFLLLLSPAALLVYGNDDVMEYLANNLKVQFTIIDNLESNTTYSARIDLTNTGDTLITDTTWEIYFCSIRMMEPDILENKSIANDGAELGNSKIKVYRVAGCLHKLKPMDDFEGFPPQELLELPRVALGSSVSRTDVMPRWYVSMENDTDAMTIVSTSSDELDFVTDFSTKEQWKRAVLDLYDPFSPELRFDHITGEDIGVAPKAVIPTPFYQDISEDKFVQITQEWPVVYSSNDIITEAEFLADKLRTVAVDISNKPPKQYIQVNIGSVSNLTDEEAYEFQVLAESSVINIAGISASGVFNGIQTLLSLVSSSLNIPESIIIDYPRFSYRGMHLDTSRNFHSKETVMKILDVMSMYKLNYLHFHITDDEGWRLEIPGIEEATEIGAKRCFDLTEETCILSQLGSGPTTSTSGTGHYTTDDYKELLQYASDRHITIIPEFDMPGHGHAIVKAMEARYKKYIDSDEDKATEFLLSDPNDESDFLSAQMFVDNTFNPCMNSTYNFIQYVMNQVKQMHENIQPLTVFNFGGDEVPLGAFEGSPICKDFVASSPDLNLTKEDLLRYFAIRVAEIAQEEGLGVAAWDDGISDDDAPYDRQSIPNENVYSYAWNDVWEVGRGEMAYLFANQDYKVILAHATYLNLDHPQEPDPEERGYYWATRFTESYKTFSYLPDDIYNNIDVNELGAPIDKDEYCKPEKRCIPLNERKRSNIIGIQGQLWSETSRSPAHVESLMFPRLLALAERAWHKAAWEENLDTKERERDWEQFANTVGYKELSRLDGLGVQYNVPPPGARIIQELCGTFLLEAKTKFPGLSILYSTDDQITWTTYTQPVSVPTNSEVFLQVRSADVTRQSRIVMVFSGSNMVTYSSMILSTILLCCLNQLYSLC